jgi:hypothetical protein
VKKQLIHLSLIATLFAACGPDVESGSNDPTVDDVKATFAGAAGKADRNSVQRVRGTSYYRIYDEPALELVHYALNTNADTFTEEGVNYVQSSFAFCAYLDEQAACVTYLDQLGPAGDNEVIRFGGTIAGRSISSSKALDLTIAIRTTLGIDTPLEEGFNSFAGRYIQCEVRATPRPSFARCAILLTPNATDVEKTVVTARFDGLEDLGEQFVYEGWLIIDGNPVSGGRFNLEENRTEVSFEFEGDLTNAELYVLTIEPAFNDDPAPSATHVLAGPFINDQADVVLEHPAALGDDFATSTGGFFLETPTSSEDDDYENGIWFLDPSVGEAALELPVLPTGWAYEGWVVGDNGPISTGTFTDVAAADSDGAGPAAGPNGAPPFPGQDFVDPAMNLVGKTIVISVEPQPDNSPAPFALKPLVGSARDVARGEVQSIGFNAQQISGTVTITLQ